MPNLGSLKEISEYVAIVSACWAIVTGVGAWKREFIGRRKIEIAEETFAAFFAVRDSIRGIRSPFSYSGEGKSRLRSADETEEESRLLDQGYVVVERYKKNENHFAELARLKYRFMAVYGAETGELFEQVNRSVSSIFISAHMLSNHHWRRQPRTEMSEAEWNTKMDDFRRHERTFWDHQDDDDEIRKSLDEVEKKLIKATASAFQKYGLNLSAGRNWFTAKFVQISRVARLRK